MKEKFPHCTTDKDITREVKRMKKLTRTHRKTLQPSVKLGLSSDVKRSVRLTCKANARRSGKPGRRVLAEIVREELYAWLIDTLRNIKGRITGGAMLAQVCVVHLGESAF